ncbi:hypothetical protein [Mycolicibacterium lutetiense]
MTDFYDETAFFEAWRSGVSLAGEHYFGNGTLSSAAASSKWGLSPDLERITHDISVLSSGEAVFLAALVSFYDGTAGTELLAQADARSFSDVAARLDFPRRQVLADLIIAYSGW